MNPGYQNEAEPHPTLWNTSVFHWLQNAKSPASEYPAIALTDDGCGRLFSTSGIISFSSFSRCASALPLNIGMPFLTPGAGHGVSSPSKSKSCMDTRLNSGHPISRHLFHTLCPSPATECI